MNERASSNGLADRLDAWSPWTTATVLAAAALVLISVDRVFPSVGMGPAYLPLIALAGWRLGLGASCCVAVLAGLLNLLPHDTHELGINAGVAVARGVVRASAYAFTVALIHALRRAYDRERTRATHDALTGTLNRAAFEREMENLLGGQQAGERAIGLALIDLDDFKRVNDTHGHGAGDHVLGALTAAATTALDGRGHLFRIGGDEFAVLLPLASIAMGRPAIERLHEDVSLALGRSLYPSTISMGSLVFQPRPSFDRAALMLGADRLLYEIKAGGKGRVRVATLPSVQRAVEPVPMDAWPLPAA